jgi:hypothetical protein
MTGNTGTKAGPPDWAVEKAQPIYAAIMYDEWYSAHHPVTRMAIALADQDALARAEEHERMTLNTSQLLQEHGAAVRADERERAAVLMETLDHKRGCAGRNYDCTCGLDRAAAIRSQDNG